MKKGFTLIELLAIVILLGVVSMIAVPIISDEIQVAKEGAYQQTIKSIEEAAKRYGTLNMLGYSTEEQMLPLETLVSSGLLDQKDLVNPKNNKEITGCVYYKWNESNKIYEYRYDSNC